MSGLLKSRRNKAATLVPLALVCAAWTASLTGVDTASASKTTHSDLPDGTAVPSQAIKAPASVPVPGSIAPSVPDGTADSVVAGASTSGIPAAALSAYQRGAQIIDAADPTCNVGWELIAAIGRVESDHGQYDGNTLSSDGVSTPGIFGPELNGQNGTQAIMDTDGGQLDHDTVYDRAVGPMQFIPSTWSSVKVDADGDGQRNPQDIDDASLATGVYLCSGTDDLSSRAGQEAAVYRYNHSRNYVDLVLRIMEAYSQGDYTAIPSGTYGGTVFSPSYASTIKSRQQHAKAQQHKAPAASAAGSTASNGGSTGSSPSSSNGGTLPNVDNTKPHGGDTLTKTLTDTTSTLTGALTGSGGSTSSPSPDPVTSTLTKSEKCLQQLGLAITTNPLTLLGANLTNYTACMAAP